MHRNILEFQPLLLVNRRGKRELHSFAYKICHSVTGSLHFLFAFRLLWRKMCFKNGWHKKWYIKLLSKQMWSVFNAWKTTLYLFQLNWIEKHSPMACSGCGPTGDHHQDCEADGRNGGPGRWRRLVWEVEDKAHHAIPPGQHTLQSSSPFLHFSFKSVFH